MSFSGFACSLVRFYSSHPKQCEVEKCFFENQEVLDDIRDGEEGENQARSRFVLRPPCSVLHRDLRQLPRLSLLFTGTVGRKTRVLRVVGEAPLDAEPRAPHAQPWAWDPREPESGWDGLRSPGALRPQLEAQPCCPSVGETRTHHQVGPMSPSGKADDYSLEGQLGRRPAPQDHVLTCAHGTPGVFSAALQSSCLPTAVRKRETREWGSTGPFHTLPRLVPRLPPRVHRPHRLPGHAPPQAGPSGT